MRGRAARAAATILFMVLISLPGFPISNCYDYVIYRLTCKNPPKEMSNAGDVVKFCKNDLHMREIDGLKYTRQQIQANLKPGDVILVDNAHVGIVNAWGGIDHYLQVSTGGKTVVVQPDGIPVGGVDKNLASGTYGGLFRNESYEQFLKHISNLKGGDPVLLRIFTGGDSRQACEAPTLQRWAGLWRSTTHPYYYAVSVVGNSVKAKFHTRFPEKGCGDPGVWIGDRWEGEWLYGHWQSTYQDQQKAGRRCGKFKLRLEAKGSTPADDVIAGVWIEECKDMVKQFPETSMHPGKEWPANLVRMGNEVVPDP